MYRYPTEPPSRWPEQTARVPKTSPSHITPVVSHHDIFYGEIKLVLEKGVEITEHNDHDPTPFKIATLS
jgi:hypothetical protein